MLSQKGRGDAPFWDGADPRGERMSKIKINVDGHDYEVSPGQSVLQACQSLGIEIPNLCWHPRTRVYGGCRLCIVEVEGMRGLPISCGTEVQAGMVIRTGTEQIHKVRKMIVELMLASGEHNCITCEQSGSCTLQRLAYQYGLDKPRFQLRGEPLPIDENNPFIVRDYSKCILCGRCLRVCNEVIGQGAVNFIQRGINAHVATFQDRTLLDSNCGMCGSCVQACPTGALSYKKALRQGRNIDCARVQTTCPYCGCGCQLDLLVKDGKVVKVEAPEDEGPNYGTTCLKGRFGFDFISSPDRLTQPLIRRGQKFEPASWEEALDFTAAKLKEIKEQHGSDAIMVASSAKATNEENYALMKFTRAALGTKNIDHCARL
jgi:predicted molibdopterin-dependent oxidoreductase YjgC